MYFADFNLLKSDILLNFEYTLFFEILLQFDVSLLYVFTPKIPKYCKFVKSAFAIPIFSSHKFLTYLFASSSLIEGGKYKYKYFNLLQPSIPL